MTTHMNIPFELTNLGIPPLAYRIGRPAPAAATPRRTERRERRVPADPDERVGKLLRAARDAKEHTAEIEKKIAETKRKLVEAEKDGDDAKKVLLLQERRRLEEEKVEAEAAEVAALRQLVTDEGLKQRVKDCFKQASGEDWPGRLQHTALAEGVLEDAKMQEWSEQLADGVGDPSAEGELTKTIRAYLYGVPRIKNHLIEEIRRLQ